MELRDNLPEVGASQAAEIRRVRAASYGFAAPAKISTDVGGSRKLDCGTPYFALPYLKVLFRAQRKLYHSFEQLVCG
jgi:hypothetical protein